MTTTMTEKEAVRLLRSREEDEEWDETEVAEVFRALYGHDYDDEEDGADAISLCYAALPPERP